MLCALLAVSCVSVVTYPGDGDYLYSGYDSPVSGQLGIGEKYYADLPCICVYEGYGFYDNLLEFQVYERTLLVKPSELAGRQDIAELSPRRLHRYSSSPAAAMAAKGNTGII